MERLGPQEADETSLRQTVVEHIDGIIVVDGEGRVCFVNPAASQILGRSESELLGELFGSAVLRGERAEIDLLHPDGATQIAEMRVVDTEWEGSTAQLISLRDITEHRRAQQALRDAEAFKWAILNSLNVHLAVVDGTGKIIAINDAWRNFARANGDPELRHTGIGVNYFTVCGQSSGPFADEAPTALEGMRAVLEGRLPIFELEYPCHSPDEERWFILRAVPLRGDSPGLVLSHENVTRQRQLARAASEAEALRAQLRARAREMRDVARLSRQEQPLARRMPLPSLRQRMPEEFQRSIHHYCEQLDEALLRRAQPDYPSELGLRDLGERLGEFEATPRDVVEIHLVGIRTASADVPQIKQQAYLEEGRLLVLELMGYLASHYRSRVVYNSDE